MSRILGGTRSGWRLRLLLVLGLVMLANACKNEDCPEASASGPSCDYTPPAD